MSSKVRETTAFILLSVSSLRILISVIFMGKLNFLFMLKNVMKKYIINKMG
jgi:hypothetical protein